MKLNSLANSFQELGFTLYIPKKREGEKHGFHHAYVRDLSRSTCLIVEGSRKKGYSTYRFSFYKSTYVVNGVKINEQVYLENASPSEVLKKVRSYVNFIERSS